MKNLKKHKPRRLASCLELFQATVDSLGNSGCYFFFQSLVGAQGSSDRWAFEEGEP